MFKLNKTGTEEAGLISKRREKLKSQKRQQEQQQQKH